MRAVFSFFSMLALGLMIAAIIMVGMTGAPNAPAHLNVPAPYLDYISVIIGLGVGLAIAIIAQVPWSQLPHRLVGFIAARRRMLKLIAWGALAVAVLFYF